MTTEVFLDTAYAIALSVPADLFHARAAALADQLEVTGTRLVTTRAVMLEIGNALSKQYYRHAAVKLLQSLEADPNVEIVPLSENLEECGELAEQVNHFEGTGVKRQKHGEPDKAKLAKEVLDVLHCTLQIAQHYGVEQELDAAIERSYQRLKSDGFIQ